MRTAQCRLFGDAFWEVADGVWQPVVEVGLWLSAGDDREPGTGPTVAKGRRIVYCDGCGSTDFRRAEVCVLTIWEFISLECLGTEVEDLRKALKDSPESFPSGVRELAEQYADALEEADRAADRATAGSPKDLRRRMTETEMAEGLNRETFREVCNRIAEETGWLRELTQLARTHRIREWQRGELVPPPFPAREGGLLDPYGAPRFIRLTCADCGRWTVLLPFGEFEVPEEWWINPEVPNPEVVRVEFDPELQRPMACILDGVPVDVIKTQRFVRERLPEGETVSRSAAGTYHVMTTIGELRLEARPAEDERGQWDWEECEWHAEFGSEKAAAKWRELKQKETTARQALAYQFAEARVRISDALPVNLRASAVLYQIENLLRLRVIEVLEARYAPTNGPQWWKTLLPQFVRKATSNRPHFQPKTATELSQCLTLPELGELIHAQWEHLEEELGVKKSRFDGWIQELTEVRNDVAHNRPLDKRTFHHLMMCVDFVRGVLRRPAQGPHQDDSA